MRSDYGQGLINFFLASKECAKVPNVPSKSSLSVKSVGIIGSGTMGGGIAMCFANAGG